MKIITVCGMGVGSSMILKLGLEDVLRKHGISADIEQCDIGSVRGLKADFVVTTPDLSHELEGSGFNVVVVKNVIDKKDIEEKIMQAISRQ